ncbi:MAG: hypothetical protein R3B96_17490 [Pirellulaceae bacterium]|nr:hypothetical protein [Planctomycetales bacterium]
MKMNRSMVLAAAAALLMPVSAMADGWGHLRGRIVVEGEVPAAEQLDVNKDVQVCGRAPLFDESLIVGEGGGLQNVVVCLMQSSRKKQEPAIHPDYANASDETPVLDNNACRFEPHVTVMTTAQKLRISNSDAVGHNANCQSIVNPFNPNIPPGGSIDIEMKGADNTPVSVVCGAHPWMKSVLLVRDEPYVAISSETGEFEIKNLPDGEWTFVFWHERGGRTKAGGYLMSLMQDGEKVGGRLGDLEVTIKDGEVTDLGTLTIAIGDLVP